MRLPVRRWRQRAPVSWSAALSGRPAPSAARCRRQDRIQDVRASSSWAGTSPRSGIPIAVRRVRPY